MKMLVKSPGFTSICPASFLKSSAGMMLSDSSPALTTTQLSSTESTSAVITSPTRISFRLRLSSNSAAKDSPPEACAGFDFWDCGAGEMLAIKKKPFPVRTFREEKSTRHVEHTGQASDRPTQFSFPAPADDALHHFVDRKCRGIEHLRIRRRNQRRNRPLGVALVSVPQIPGKGAQISIDSFFYQLLIAPFGPDFRTGCQEHLQVRLREDDGAHIAAVRDQSWGSAEGPLALKQRLAQGRHLRELGSAVSDWLAADLFGHRLVVEHDFAVLEHHIHFFCEPQERPLIDGALPEGEQRHEPVERTALEVMEAQALRDAARDRPFARGRGTVDRDHRCLHARIVSSSRK